MAGDAVHGLAACERVAVKASMAQDGMDVEIAVALFEKGYPEAGRKAAAAPPPAPPAPPVPEKPVRRRATWKKASTLLQRVLERKDSKVSEESTPPPVRRARAIEPSPEGQRWWRQAAARWPKIYQNLRLEASLSILRPECPDVAGYLGKVHLQRVADGCFSGVAETPVRKRAPELEEVAAADGSNNNRSRQASDASCRSPQRTSTPSRCSSPQAMLLNSQADMCKFCYCDTSPWRSVRLGCGHGWYCDSCMLRHAEARLVVGATRITCPECNSPVAEHDLRKLLPAETIDRLLARCPSQISKGCAMKAPVPAPRRPSPEAIARAPGVAMKAVKPMKAMKAMKAKSGVKTMKDMQVQFTQRNDKTPGTAAFARYEKYKGARSISQARRLGATRGDIFHDRKKKFLVVRRRGLSVAAP